MIEREPSNEQSLLNEVNIDFRILGMPHSVVKQAQNSRVRELVKKIENHPHRHSLQRDLQPNEAYTPFSTMTKQMIQNVGNVRFFELFETDPKTQCTESLTVCMRHDEWGTKSRHLSHIVMCKESNEDDTKETLQTNKRHSRVFKCFSRECTHASSLRPRFYVLLCLLLCFVSSIQSSSVFPRLHFSLVCEFLVILCNCSHCENGSFEVLSLQLQHGSKLSTIEMCDQCHLCKISWKKCTIPLIGSVFTRNRLCKQCWMDFRSICMVSCQNMQVVREQSHDQDFGWWREKNQLPSCVRLHNHHGYGTFIVIVSKTWPDVDILFLVWNGLAVKINSSGEDLQHKRCAVNTFWCGRRSVPNVSRQTCAFQRTIDWTASIQVLVSRKEQIMLSKWQRKEESENHWVRRATKSNWTQMTCSQWLCFSTPSAQIARFLITFWRVKIRSKSLCLRGKIVCWLAVARCTDW